MEPLTPPDCDLRDFQFMPIDIVRLFGSRFHAVASDSEWRAGVTLWLRSFHQVPAASLPDDDVELARLAELGRDVKSWRKLRAGALHGWVKATDGRLYHPVVAEKAIEAFKKKEFYRERSRKANAKRWGGLDSQNEHQGSEGRETDEQIRPRENDKGQLKASNKESLKESNEQSLYDSHCIPRDSKGTGTVKESSGAAASRGSRLSEDFVMPAEWLEWAMSEKGWSKRDTHDESASFVDYWHAKSGKDATKVDWQATWRNWVRNSRRTGSVLPFSRRDGDEPDMPAYA